MTKPTRIEMATQLSELRVRFSKLETQGKCMPGEKIMNSTQNMLCFLCFLPTFYLFEWEPSGSEHVEWEPTNGHAFRALPETKISKITPSASVAERAIDFSPASVPGPGSCRIAYLATATARFASSFFGKININ